MTVARSRDRSEAATQLLSLMGRRCKDVVVLRDWSGIVSGEFRDVDLLSATLIDYLKSAEWISDAQLEGLTVLRAVERYGYYQVFLYSSRHSVHLIVDVWRTLSIKGVEYLKVGSDELVRTGIENISRLKTDVAAFIAITKCLTQSGIIKEKYLDILCLDDYVQACRSNGVPIWIMCLQGRPKWQINLALFRHLAKYLEYWKWLASMIVYSVKRKQKIIYLIGPDGAGKTTCASLLMKDFSMTPNIQYLHGGIHVLPRIADVIYALRSGRIRSADPKRFNPEIAMKSEHKESTGTRFGVLHFVYYSLDAILASLYVMLNYWQDRLLLCDRTIYDIVARQGYSDIVSWMKTALVALTPRPDRAFLLYCEPARINARKPELSITEIQSQYKHYKEIDTYVSLEILPTDGLSNTRAALAGLLEH